ncbi:hypothetical protein COT95_00040 [Candidatus Falkowbacteria bacterium CG10_big_fil_rev_8_21_14_0_10_37_6]|uniref:SHSP domain-containing protein n=1 Tax=Candidatus Falkowbacteria bacterium CG10_big_fil_rev_8_21_14_0_10_37_6 TaxID=1974563 RepID=A0A2H0V7Z2_9BACT|nr:MAG: hypothetical protein COT95_00040 [Candidatus Falkowbacteria bacterium CG10_big_fil_rev_8_21_14_0_10_37_6]
MKFFKNLAGLNKKTNVEITEEQTNKQTDQSSAPDLTDQWFDQDYEEGQLAIDVYQTEKDIVVKSTIAGVKPEDIDISVNNDMLTIRGVRKLAEEVSEENYFYQECYWGSFSRSIILPIEVKTDKIDAIIENGVLTVKLPKIKTNTQVSIKVKD